MTTHISSSLILHPSEFAPQLIEYLTRDAEIKRILPRRRLSFHVGNKRFCYVILKGSGAVYRSSDDRLIATVSGPALLGLSNTHKKETDAYIKTQVLCEVVILETEAVYNIINANQLWEPLAKYMMGLAGKLFHSGEQLSAPSAYDLIRAQLYELINEPPFIRENTTVERYIREKTHLSRSGVMRILAALKEGGFIEMNRGKLITISKLPEKF